MAPALADQAFVRETLKDYTRGVFDESSRAHAQQAGRFRAPLLRELVSPRWFEGEAYTRVLEARGFIDTLFVVFPINVGAERYYGFHRTAAAGVFSDPDRAIAGYALRGLKWFHRRLMLSHGLLVARSPVTRTEQRILRLLLTDLTEKEIAARIGLADGTVHKYVTRILRKFGVSGRAGLTALWLGKA